MLTSAFKAFTAIFRIMSRSKDMDTFLWTLILFVANNKTKMEHDLQLSAQSHH